MTALERALRSERRMILRALGVTCEADVALAESSARRFVERLRELGADPDAAPARLTRTGPGGRPRRDAPETLARRRRYRALRALGLSSREATAACKSSVRFARARAEARP